MVAHLLMRGGSWFFEAPLGCCIIKGAGLCKAFSGPCFFITPLLLPRTFLCVLQAVFALAQIKQTARRLCRYVPPPSFLHRRALSSLRCHCRWVALALIV